MLEQSPRPSRREFMAVMGAGVASLSCAALPAAGEVVAAGGAAASGSAAQPPSLENARDAFLLPDDLVYLNNGTLGPCPRVVLEAAAGAWREMESNPADEMFGPFIERMEEARAKAAAFLGCDPAELCITRNTTEGMGALAQGVRLAAGDVVLTTDHEHPGGLVAWEYLVRHEGIAIEKVRLPVPPEGEEAVVRLFAEKLTPKVKVISVSHVTATTGLRLPIAALAALAREHGALLVVDGAQGPGALRVNVRELGCDAYATSAHKWLLAPRGTGLLYIRSEARERIDPMLLAAGPSAYTAATGTRDAPGIVGLGAAIDFLAALGPERVEAHAMGLRAALIERLRDVPGVKVASPAEGPMASPIVAVEMPAGADAGAVAAALKQKHRVIVKVIPEHVNGLRISLHVYNSARDLEALVGALRAEVSG